MNHGLKGKFWLRALVAVILTAVTVAAPADTPPTLPKDVKLPANVSLAIYMPAQVRRWRAPLQGPFGTSRTMEDTVLSAGQIYFADSHLAETGTDTPFGLLLALHPEMKTESGRLRYTLNYAVFAADSQPLMKNTESVTVEGFDLERAALQAVQRVMATMITGLRPDEHKFPAALNLKTRSLEFAVNHDKPWATGTGFYFNSSGQALTAAHVIHDCVKVEVKRDDTVLTARVLATSNVVDLAALDTGATSTAFLALRRDTPIELGEPATNVSFPLQSILVATPNLTRGNVSARGGLTGAVGQFQFSAPIQPGASGGPVVSDGGELLGVTVSTLNAGALARQGAIPQNVNFALEARYVAKFLQKGALAYTTVEPNPHGDAHIANQAALAAVVSVQCYE